MLQIAQQTLNFLILNNTPPTKNDLTIENSALNETKWSIFVTLYKDGNIVSSSGNIKEIENDLINEIIANTFDAYKKMLSESISAENIQIRVDFVSQRTLLQNKSITEINPVSHWVIVIKKTQDKAGVILPNISTNITSWKDFIAALSMKLWENFEEENYYVYEIATQSFTSF